MMENSTYSVITPEGCAAILWGKSEADNVSDYAKVAAESLQLTAPALQKTGLVDELIREPIGGAHRDHAQAAELVGQALAKHLAAITALSLDELRELRYKKFRSFGSA
jgi:acetyl-CoA carboxylase carboxyl transferase subunit alpha